MKKVKINKTGAKNVLPIFAAFVLFGMCLLSSIRAEAMIIGQEPWRQAASEAFKSNKALARELLNVRIFFQNDPYSCFVKAMCNVCKAREDCISVSNRYGNRVNESVIYKISNLRDKAERLMNVSIEHALNQAKNLNHFKLSIENANKDWEAFVVENGVMGRGGNGGSNCDHALSSSFSSSSSPSSSSSSPNSSFSSSSSSMLMLDAMWKDAQMDWRVAKEKNKTVLLATTEKADAWTKVMLAWKTAASAWKNVWKAYVAAAMNGMVPKEFILQRTQIAFDALKRAKVNLTHAQAQALASNTFVASSLSLSPSFNPSSPSFSYSLSLIPSPSPICYSSPNQPQIPQPSHGIKPNTMPKHYKLQPKPHAFTTSHVCSSPSFSQSHSSLTLAPISSGSKNGLGEGDAGLASTSHISIPVFSDSIHIPSNSTSNHRSKQPFVFSPIQYQDESRSQQLPFLVSVLPTATVSSPPLPPVARVYATATTFPACGSVLPSSSLSLSSNSSSHPATPLPPSSTKTRIQVPSSSSSSPNSSSNPTSHTSPHHLIHRHYHRHYHRHGHGSPSSGSSSSSSSSGSSSSSNSTHRTSSHHRHGHSSPSFSSSYSSSGSSSSYSSSGSSSSYSSSGSSSSYSSSGSSSSYSSSGSSSSSSSTHRTSSRHRHGHSLPSSSSNSSSPSSSSDFSSSLPTLNPNSTTSSSSSSFSGPGTGTNHISSTLISAKSNSGSGLDAGSVADSDRGSEGSSSSSSATSGDTDTGIEGSSASSSLPSSSSSPSLPSSSSNSSSSLPTSNSNLTTSSSSSSSILPTSNPTTSHPRGSSSGHAIHITGNEK